MMAATHASAEFRVSSSVGKGFDQAAGPTLVARDAAGSDYDRFAAENARLRRELDRLEQENDDLRKSADIWIRLYERQLARAKTLADLLARCTAALPR
jgi:hypothetical protein